jgi:hypothetical protein
MELLIQSVPELGKSERILSQTHSLPHKWNME